MRMAHVTNYCFRLKSGRNNGRIHCLISAVFRILCLALLVQAPLPAQDVESAGAAPKAPQTHAVFELGGFARNIWNDQKLIWTTPARMNSRQWLTIAAPFAGVTAGLIATDERAMTLVPEDHEPILWCGRISDLGALYSLGGFSVGMLVTGKVAKKNWVFRVGQGSSEALVNAVIVGYSLKYGTARERPQQNDGQGRFWKGGDSFPSGHSMDTWAVATSIARTRKCPKWIAIASYGMATAVSLSRWGAEKHFPSDIVVGGVFGWFIGNHVARRPR
jgi:membrane-associated phospholipid phosphatase